MLTGTFLGQETTTRQRCLNGKCRCVEVNGCMHERQELGNIGEVLLKLECWIPRFFNGSNRRAGNSFGFSCFSAGFFSKVASSSVRRSILFVVFVDF